MDDPRPRDAVTIGRGDRLLDEILTITPTVLATWHRCARALLLDRFLGVPPSDAAPVPAEANLVHDLLRQIHRHGSCHDAAHVEGTLAGHGDAAQSASVRGFVERHTRRCPRRVERGEHEAEHARFHRSPPPMFMATGRIDAVWVHEGLLDARDYKTGHPAIDRVAEDPAARVQAWLLAPVAERHGLTLRLRYELLAPDIDDDPDPFQPDRDDLAAIEEELLTTAAAIRAERQYVGVNDLAVCRFCQYRSVCRDSAVRAQHEEAVPA